jgi:chemotaxis protein CheX
MQVAESDLLQLATDIWASVLAFDIEPAQSTPDRFDRLTGCVQIAGAWRGSVTLETSREFARAAAATMFAMPGDNVTSSEIVDALAELTNMLGGNIKSILPGPSFLALPSVTEGSDYELNLPSTRPLSKLTFSCLNDGMSIKVFEFTEEPLTFGQGSNRSSS